MVLGEEGAWRGEHGEHRPLRRPDHKDFPSSHIPQGLFFDDSYGFYPGQVLIGPAKIFSSVQWLSGVKPVLSTKSKFRVVVEEVGPGGWGAHLRAWISAACPSLPALRAQPRSLVSGPCWSDRALTIKGTQAVVMG